MENIIRSESSKKKVKRCTMVGCEKGARKGGVCCSHGATKKRCTMDGCEKFAQKGGVCCSHGAKVKRCIFCKMIYGTKRKATSTGETVLSCIRCFFAHFPNEPKINNRYKLKQHYINEILKETFGKNFFVYDKRVNCGSCSRKIPDWRVDCYHFNLIVECDEFSHEIYSESCEKKRLNGLWEDLGCRDLVVIRFNPDKNEEDSGCFKPIPNGGYEVNEERIEKRMDKLIKTIYGFLENGVNQHGLEVIEMFYDK